MAVRTKRRRMISRPKKTRAQILLEQMKRKKITLSDISKDIDQQMVDTALEELMPLPFDCDPLSDGPAVSPLSEDQKRRLGRMKVRIADLLELIRTWLRVFSTDIDAIRENFHQCRTSSIIV